MTLSWTITVLATVHLLTTFAESVQSVKSTERRQVALVHRSETRCLSQNSLTCFLRPTVGSTVKGIVRFQPVFRKTSQSSRCKVQITAQLTGLSPGAHGFHIHTYGDVQADDATSAGGHFTNPRGDDIIHGLPNDGVRHWGDLGNILAATNGSARYFSIDSLITLRGILGRGMVVHELEDQGAMEQPTGAAGAREASCVIGFANPDL